MKVTGSVLLVVCRLELALYACRHYWRKECGLRDTEIVCKDCTSYFQDAAKQGICLREAFGGRGYFWVVDFSILNMTVTLLVSIRWLPLTMEGSIQLVQTSSFLCCQLVFSTNKVFKTGVCTDLNGILWFYVVFFIAVLLFLVSYNLFRTRLLKLVGICGTAVASTGRSVLLTN